MEDQLQNIELDVDFIYFGYRFKIKSSRKSVKMNIFTLDNRYSFLSCTTYAANQTVHAHFCLVSPFSLPHLCPKAEKRALSQLMQRTLNATDGTSLITHFNK